MNTASRHDDHLYRRAARMVLDHATKSIDEFDYEAGDVDELDLHLNRKAVAARLLEILDGKEMR